MTEREQLIAALMNPETSTVVDFESSYKDLYVYGCDHERAARCADKILAEGGTNRSLQIMNDEVLRNGQRKLNIEHRERIHAQQERSIAAAVDQRSPIRKSDAQEVAIRGGQPGSWFQIDDPYNGGGVEYVSAGASVREPMERKVRSAFAR
jgi:cobalamin-dependent methionine synthase I